MSLMDNLKKLKKKLTPEKKPIRNNIPKEKENVRQSFAVYCNANHDTKDGHLCAKCNALLMRTMQRFVRCRYGATKPICDMCEARPDCFGKDEKMFTETMNGAKNRMLLKHPVTAVKHRLLKAGTDYAMGEKKRNDNEAAVAKRQAKRDRKKKKAEAAAPAAPKEQQEK